MTIDVGLKTQPPATEIDVTSEKYRLDSETTLRRQEPKNISAMRPHPVFGGWGLLASHGSDAQDDGGAGDGQG